MSKSGAFLGGRVPIFLKAMLVQGGVLGILVAVVAWLPAVVPPPYPLWGWVAAQSALAVLLSGWLGLPRWWLWIQGLFPPLLWLALQEQTFAAAAGVVVLVLWLVFRNALTEGVPLYLSNVQVQKAVCVAAKTLEKPVAFCDLGCGWGQMVRYMGRDCVDTARSVGVETAWLSYWIAKWRVGRQGEVYRMDLWTVDLRAFNLVYAFLSPAPMARLEEKVLAEMAPRSLFISNSFPLPHLPPTEIWQLNDRRGTHLYLYRFDGAGKLIPPKEEAYDAG